MHRTPRSRRWSKADATGAGSVIRVVKRHAMKAILTTSIVCSAVSLLGLLGLSAMSVAPGAEGLRWGMMLAVVLILAVWVRLGFWARGRLRASAGAAAVSARLRTAVITGGVIYVLLVLLCSVG